MKAVSPIAFAIQLVLAGAMVCPGQATAADEHVKAPAIQGQLARLETAGETKGRYPREVRRRPVIAFEWDPNTRSARFDLATGCLATSARNVRDTFFLTIDRQDHTLTIHGDFWYTQPGNRSTRDCMKRTTRLLPAGELDPGLYTVRFHDQVLWILELGTEPVNHRTGGKS